eukprot:7790779-Alexandrium_andersonii.AAC.1
MHWLSDQAPHKLARDTEGSCNSAACNVPGMRLFKSTVAGALVFVDGGRPAHATNLQLACNDIPHTGQPRGTSGSEPPAVETCWLQIEHRSRPGTKLPACDEHC